MIKIKKSPINEEIKKRGYRNKFCQNVSISTRNIFCLLHYILPEKLKIKYFFSCGKTFGGFTTLSRDPKTKLKRLF